MKIDVADLDVVYLSYDEPQKEEFWIKIQNMIPWAVRVDGVKGSDAAHKAAADASATDRFILIDGDNLPDERFFNLTLDFDDTSKDAVLRWRARNHINGLMYGNGGLSSWTKDFVYNMKTHENSAGDDATDVEFCFDPLYWAMHDCYSTTYPNGSAYHAWRAGFREGVKMCLDRGRKPSVSEFKERLHARNLDHLTVWHNVGRDVEYGDYAILGARMGTYKTMLTDWDYRKVQWFDNLNEIYHQEIASVAVEDKIANFGEKLSRQLNLPELYLNSDASTFFKQHYKSNWHNRGIMTSEIDIIRSQEGW